MWLISRASNPLVNVRARAATDLILTLSPQMTTFLDNALGDSEAMQNTVHWCDNQQPSTATFADGASRSVDRPATPETGAVFREMIRADNIVHPDGMHQR